MDFAFFLYFLDGPSVMREGGIDPLEKDVLISLKRLFKAPNLAITYVKNVILSEKNDFVT